MKAIVLDHSPRGYRYLHKKLAALILLFLALSLVTACTKDAPANQPADQSPSVAAKPSPEAIPPQTAATPPPTPASAQPEQKPKPQPAPAVTGPAAVVAYDLDGNRRQLSEWIGKKPTVVNFWGTWCPPCRREIPELVKMYEEFHSKGVEIVSLAIERTYGPTQVKDFAKQNGMKWVLAMGAREMAEPFRLSGGVPETIFYDKNGNELERFIGPRDYKTFKAAFERILAAK
jgi:thiol-disulfide isomerase/thioredoxin